MLVLQMVHEHGIETLAIVGLIDEFRERHEATGGEVIVEWSELFKRRRKEHRLDDWGAEGEALLSFAERPAAEKPSRD